MDVYNNEVGISDAKKAKETTNEKSILEQYKKRLDKKDFKIIKPRLISVGDKK